jgi:peroxiredoxin
MEMLRAFYLLVVLQILVMGCSAKKDDKQNQGAAAQVVNDYPDLMLTMEDGQQVATRTLQGKNMFIFFQPGCDHCQEEAAEIKQQLERFNAYTLYFISSGAMPEIMNFARDYGLNNQKNVKFAFTATEGVLNHYGPIQTPSVYIYADGKLLKSFNGQTAIDSIISSL